jgi:ribonuclease HI
MPLYKDELSDKASQLRDALKNENVEISFNDGNFRDYLLIISVKRNGQPAGKISLYYKPSKNAYSVKKQIENECVSRIVDEIWDNLNGSAAYGADSGIYEAFVDGSYISGVTGYGAVIYLGNELKAEIAGTILDVEFRQFGGELRSVIEVLKWCAANNAAKVRINYDYQGIEKFATGEWKPKNNLSKDYVDFVKKANIGIEWRHIKSHTGNSKNDEADALAKKAAMAASSTVSKRFVNLENKALDFIDFINKSRKYFARYAGAENGESAGIEVKNKETEESAVIDIIYAKANNFSIRQPKSAIEADIYNLWQEFLFIEDFKN